MLMPESDLGNTQPTRVKTSSSPKTALPLQKQKNSFPFWVGPLVFVVLLALGTLAGVGFGQEQRFAAEKTQSSQALRQQLELGLQALNAGQYEIARVHLDYVLHQDPNYPGLQAAYAELSARTQATASPTFTPLPSPTATPDNRNAEEQYTQVVELLSESNPNLCSRDWDGILAALDSLRQAASDDHTADVDGMYYIALESRGICRIYPQLYEPNVPCSQLNLNMEGGILDLTLAERFGPLDSISTSLRNYARLYIAGASFWNLDWAQAQTLFAQVKAAYPNLMDASCLNAAERWRQATLKYAEQLEKQGDACGAQKQYEAAFATGSPLNAPSYPAATEAANGCHTGGG
jgi:hypothetical protein